jgi:3-oxoacyl-[acyl-carrier protein] reductase
VRALVFGGSGTIGREVVRELRRAEVAVAFTYHRQAELAAALASELGARCEGVDVTARGAVVELSARLAADGFEPDVLVLATGRLEASSYDVLGDDAFDAALAHGRAAFSACREIGKGMAARGSGDIVVVGGLDRAQSLPVPVAYAAAQGMLSAMTMALAKELGPRGVRINMLALGLLDAGLSLGLGQKVRQDYLAYSALRRFGTAPEAARAIVSFALENRAVNGKVIAMNGL